MDTGIVYFEDFMEIGSKCLLLLSKPTFAMSRSKPGIETKIPIRIF